MFETNCLFSICVYFENLNQQNKLESFLVHFHGNMILCDIVSNILNLLNYFNLDFVLYISQEIQFHVE